MSAKKIVFSLIRHTGRGLCLVGTLRRGGLRRQGAEKTLREGTLKRRRVIVLGREGWG